MNWSWWHDYEFTGVNWINWTLCAAEYERSHYCGTSELHFALFGLHTRVTWIHDAAKVEAFRIETNARLAEYGLGDD